MPNGVRNSIWAVFFLAGMAFMAALIFMVRPELFSNSAVREKPGTSIVLADSFPEPEAISAEAPPAAPSLPIAEPMPATAKKERRAPTLETPVVHENPEAAPELPVVPSIAVAPPSPAIPLTSQVANAAGPECSWASQVDWQFAAAKIVPSGR